MISTNLEQWPLSGLATAAVVLAALYAAAYQLQRAKSNAREPPIITSYIPFVGHLLGMAVEGGRYCKSLGLAHRDKPIFTLPVPGSRIYVVTDPSLAAAVQRASKALSFSPIVPDITRRVLGLDAATVAQLRLHQDPEPGDPRGFLADMHDLVYGHLGPGRPLSDLTAAAAGELASHLNDYADGLVARPAVVDLLAWTRHLVTVATARFLYGPHNPIAAHPELEVAFWDFVHGLGLLLVDVVPSVTARRGYVAREALAAAFVEYLDAGHQRTGSALVQQRIAITERYGWTHAATARSELSFLFAGIINSAVTTFWVVLEIFARPELLATVRAELEPALSSSNGSSRTLSIDAVRTRCPTLQAVFRECLRVGSENMQTRLVKQDTMLAEKHFLKAGSVLQVAAGVIHADAAIWGPDVDEFNAARFLPKDPAAAVAAHHPAAFRSFGGGRTLCPGRHFATSEITVFVALIVLRFDMEAVDGGAIAVPPKNDRVLPIHILEPKASDAPKVRIKLRDGLAHGPLTVVA